MKKIFRLILVTPAFLFLAGCDKNFKEINTNPQQINNVDPGYLFTNALRNTPAFNWMGESTIVQQFVLPYNLGTTSGYQFNENVDGLNNGPWNAYTGSIKYLEQVISVVKDNAARKNLYNETRIWRAYNYMWLVDHYGDLPYTEAGKGLTGALKPKYDKADAIYTDLYKELKEATQALNASGDNTSNFDIFVAIGTSTANENLFWKKLGNSLLLRLGMRYSKLDANKAKSIVQDAFNGGVMQSNADNAIVRNMDDAGLPITGYNSAVNNTIRTVNPFNYYLAEPLVTKLKSYTDPRLKYISARYTPNQNTAPSVTNPDTTLANQYGFPIGYSDATLSTLPGYRPSAGQGQDYSQINFNVAGNSTAPMPIITNAQTKLLLAEAAYKGWLTGLAGALTAQQYYEAGIKASMDEYDVYPSTIKPKAVPTNLQDQYLTVPGVSWNNADALNQINTQYWIASFNNGYEAWSNWRRSGFPVLLPNKFNNNLNGGFIRRFAYPLREVSANEANYTQAVTSIGGKDDLTTQVFWDKP
ncbi:MAG: SusD/RagB family nutrient-binding outer membrane lipoprotein [Williamsia sp.]|nr:SusD/RagB family nutrient-binding outer membrane lipoprotein [Williamsia sp.]